MGDKVSYTPGSKVWVKFNKVWWPGNVIESSDIPHELLQYLKNCIAAVHFAGDDSYEFIKNPRKICLYSCPKKLEFIEKGYELYTKQKKSGKKRYGLDMNLFIKDILSIETSLGGDINIFKQFETNQSKDTELRENINDLSNTSKEEERSKLLCGPPKSPKKISEPPKVVECTSIPLVKNNLAHSNTIKDPRHIGSYKCYTNDNCSFTTNRFELLKRHTHDHKIEVQLEEEKFTINQPNTSTSISTNDYFEPSGPPQKKIKNENNQETKDCEIIFDNVNEVNNTVEETLDDKSGKLVKMSENESVESVKKVENCGKIVNINYENSQQDESEILDDIVHDSKNTVAKTFDDKSMVIIGNESVKSAKKVENLEESLCHSLSNKIDLSVENAQRSEDGKVKNEVLKENNLTMAKDDEIKLQSTGSKHTVPPGFICCMDEGPVPLADLTEEDDAAGWNTFYHNLKDDIRSFTTIPTPESYLRTLMAQEIESLWKPTVTPIVEENLICHEVHPGGPPPGYKRIEVFAPYPDDALTEEEAMKNPVMKKVKKLIKEGKSEDVKVTLKCVFLREIQ